MPSWSLEPLTPADLDEVVVIERASFATPWSRGAFLYEMKQNPAARCWVARGAKSAPSVLGYLCLWEIPPEIHITNLAVHPDWRRQGIARALVEAILEDARRRQLSVALLEVRPTNAEALSLYEGLGFQVVGRRRGYYFDTGEDALLMQADLTPSPSSPPPHPASPHGGEEKR
ncbi:MAG: ribosomal protein S18-alanine N-acetyltransferase [Candidatus Rokubacteria bacterium]|nr:ribosomal protein S18-alanine N-acetyltransferase [Candidatus Rokubacteria bacterium]MBI2554797.1 ribosomal protein S18-alanine N-acetyltransferase [Candidatus Rokubacteria bacterium]